MNQEKRLFLQEEEDNLQQVKIEIEKLFFISILISSIIFVSIIIFMFRFIFKYINNVYKFNLY